MRQMSDFCATTDVIKPDATIREPSYRSVFNRQGRSKRNGSSFAVGS